MSAAFAIGRVFGRFAAHLADRLAAWIIGDDWNRHVNQALHTVRVEHTIRPMFEALVVADDDMGLFCHDCNSVLNGRWDTANAMLAAYRHRQEAHT